MKIPRSPESARHRRVYLPRRVIARLLEGALFGREQGLKKLLHAVHFLTGQTLFFRRKIGDPGGNGRKEALTPQILDLQVREFLGVRQTRELLSSLGLDLL